MKKSEMADKLQDILINMGFKSEYECGCCHKEPTFEEATSILDILEQLGMLPPPNGIFNKINPLVKGEYKWEPEDDNN